MCRDIRKQPESPSRIPRSFLSNCMSWASGSPSACMIIWLFRCCLKWTAGGLSSPSARSSSQATARILAQRYPGCTQLSSQEAPLGPSSRTQASISFASPNYSSPKISYFPSFRFTCDNLTASTHVVKSGSILQKVPCLAQTYALPRSLRLAGFFASASSYLPTLILVYYIW